MGIVKSQLRVVAVLTPLPTAYTEKATFAMEGSRAEMRCVFERLGSLYSGGFAFGQVRAVKHVAEAHTSPWHLWEGTGVLVEVENSEWVRKLRAAQPGYSDEWTPRHFAIYVESFGAYEIAALEVIQLPEVSLMLNA
jgi:hypothetical protein